MEPLTKAEREARTVWATFVAANGSSVRDGIAQEDHARTILRYEETVKRLEAALAFYADPARWLNKPGAPYRSAPEGRVVLLDKERRDGWRVALEAIEAIEGG